MVHQITKGSLILSKVEGRGGPQEHETSFDFAQDERCAWGKL